MKEDNNKVRVGGFWQRPMANGEKFLSGSLNLDGKEVSLMIFKNGFKHENPKGPDFVAYQVPVRQKTEQKEKEKVVEEEKDESFL